ncbi:MAG TPA: hypothetical protein VN088_19975 [Nocardioides sp.]|nr:hypothetical protein [Nocardioides sp.]
MTTTPEEPLNDDDLLTSEGEPLPGQGESYGGGGDADGTDGDGTDGTDGDTSDGDATDGDGTDGTDGAAG